MRVCVFAHVCVCVCVRETYLHLFSSRFKNTWQKSRQYICMCSCMCVCVIVRVSGEGRSLSLLYFEMADQAICIHI